MVFNGAVSFGQGAGNYPGRLEASWTPGAYVATKPIEVGKSIGSEFLNADWYYGNIKLYTGEIKGYPLKYSLLHSRMEILTEEGIKILNENRIKAFSWKSPETLEEHHFVNGKEFTTQGVPVTGVLEVLYDGEIGLYKRYVFKVKKGTYIPSHDAGQLEDEYRIDEIIMLEQDNALTIIGNKRDFLSIFGDESDKIRGYSKSRKLSYKNTSDLIEIIKYVETLL